MNSAWDDLDEPAAVVAVGQRAGVDREEQERHPVADHREPGERGRVELLEHHPVADDVLDVVGHHRQQAEQRSNAGSRGARSAANGAGTGVPAGRSVTRHDRRAADARATDARRSARPARAAARSRHRHAPSARGIGATPPWPRSAASSRAGSRACATRTCPPAVVDRAKGVTLHALASALLGAQPARGARSARADADEESGGAGRPTVLVDGAKLTKAGAAFVNAEMVLAGGKWDTFRMLTHPGHGHHSGGAGRGRGDGASGSDFSPRSRRPTRSWSGWPPTSSRRSWRAASTPARSSPPSALRSRRPRCAASTRSRSTTRSRTASSLAAGNLEGARSGGRALREGAAVRNALLAAALAREGMSAARPCSKARPASTILTPATTTGRLIYSFTGDTRARLDAITAGLGRDWIFLETLYRIYSTSGYNIAHVDVTAQLCEEHDIKPAGRRARRGGGELAGDAVPEPGIPAAERDGRAPRPGAPHTSPPTASSSAASPCCSGRHRGRRHPPAVLDLMKRVTLIPSHTQTLFGPRITIFTQGRQELHACRAPAASSSGTSPRRRGGIRGVVPACRSPPRSSTRSSRPAATSTARPAPTR